MVLEDWESDKNHYEDRETHRQKEKETESGFEQSLRTDIHLRTLSYYSPLLVACLYYLGGLEKFDFVLIFPQLNNLKVAY